MRWFGSCALVVLAACGGAPMTASGDFPAEPLMILTSMSGALRLELRTAPQPPSRVVPSQRAQYIITDTASGVAVNGLSLDVLPWMPVMGHGTSVVPSVAETNAGVFEVDNLNLFMPGLWALRTTITTSAVPPSAAVGAPSDYVEPSFEVP
jgi:hypothetical protein